MTDNQLRRAPLPMLPCLCGNLRRAARLVSISYENEPGWPRNLGIAQFSLLQAIAREGTITHARLGWLLGLDETTVSRSLALLRKHGLTRVARGADRRERWVTLSTGGQRNVQQMERAWRRVQARLRRRYGANRWRDLERALTTLASLVSIPAGLN